MDIIFGKHSGLCEIVWYDGRLTVFLWLLQMNLLTGDLMYLPTFCSRFIIWLAWN